MVLISMALVLCKYGINTMQGASNMISELNIVMDFARQVSLVGREMRDMYIPS